MTEKKENREGKFSLSIRQIATVSIFTALLCVLAPMSLPIGPVPVTLTNLVLYISVYVLGTRLSLYSYLIYFLLGLAGLPVFSGFSGGLGKVSGPTGGFLIGFFLMIGISGILVKKFIGNRLLCIAGMILGTLCAYLLGVLWFMFSTGSGFLYALTICVLPFLIGDFLKIAAASYLGPLLRNTLKKASLLPDQT
ncbi:MAG: biotin transporter BioY [Lachnospiraceae bacterium]